MVSIVCRAFFLPYITCSSYPTAIHGSHRGGKPPSGGVRAELSRWPWPDPATCLFVDGVLGHLQVMRGSSKGACDRFSSSTTSSSRAGRGKYGGYVATRLVSSNNPDPGGQPHTHTGFDSCRTGGYRAWVRGGACTGGKRGRGGQDTPSGARQGLR